MQSKVSGKKKKEESQNLKKKINFESNKIAMIFVKQGPRLAVWCCLWTNSPLLC